MSSRTKRLLDYCVFEPSSLVGKGYCCITYRLGSEVYAGGVSAGVAAAWVVEAMIGSITLAKILARVQFSIYVKKSKDLISLW